MAYNHSTGIYTTAPTTETTLLLTDIIKIVIIVVVVFAFIEMSILLFCILSKIRHPLPEDASDAPSASYNPVSVTRIDAIEMEVKRQEEEADLKEVGIMI